MLLSLLAACEDRENGAHGLSRRRGFRDRFGRGEAPFRDRLQAKQGMVAKGSDELGRQDVRAACTHQRQHRLEMPW